MKVNASRIYTENRTSSSQPWINFLVETDFGSLHVGKANTVTLSYNMRILSCINRMESDYDTRIHAAQYLGYLYVRNTNSTSADYNKALWLGVGCFDNRFKLFRSCYIPEGVTESPVSITPTCIYIVFS